MKKLMQTVFLLAFVMVAFVATLQAHEDGSVPTETSIATMGKAPPRSSSIGAAGSAIPKKSIAVQLEVTVARFTSSRVISTGSVGSAKVLIGGDRAAAQRSTALAAAKQSPTLRSSLRSSSMTTPRLHIRLGCCCEPLRRVIESSVAEHVGGHVHMCPKTAAANLMASTLRGAS